RKAVLLDIQEHTACRHLSLRGARQRTRQAAGGAAGAVWQALARHRHDSRSRAQAGTRRLTAGDGKDPRAGFLSADAAAAGRGSLPGGRTPGEAASCVNAFGSYHWSSWILRNGKLCVTAADCAV